MNWKIIWKSLSDQDMRKRILAVLGILVIFRILAHIPIPLSDSESLRQVLETLFSSGGAPQFLNFVNVLSGNALANFSIMLIGLGPYINASIITQLLTRAVPKLEALNKEGEYGRKKINQMTRLLTLPLAIIQSIGALYLVRQGASQLAGLGDITANTSIIQWVLMIAALTGGSMMLMWLGELITEQSIGNGISLIITVGIISSLPGIISNLKDGLLGGGDKLSLLGVQTPLSQNGLIFAVSMLIAVIIVIVSVVKLNEAARRLTINYAKRVQGNRTYGGVTTVLPVKLITAGVIPIIFAVAFLSVPSFAGQILTSSDSETLRSLGLNLTQWFASPSTQTFSQGGIIPFIYPVTYFALVFAFTFFYTSITFNSKDIAENLQKQGAFISGVRSGNQTEKYLSKVVNRLTLFGAIALGLLAILPIIGQMFIQSSIVLQGTAILILVSVALDTLRKIESRALMITYDTYDGTDFFQEVDSDKASGSRRRRLLRKIRRS